MPKSLHVGLIGPFSLWGTGASRMVWDFLFIIFKGYCSLLSVAMMNTMILKKNNLCGKVYFILHVQVIIHH